MFVVLFLRLVWRLARPIAAMIRGNGQSSIRRMLADLWPILMTVYVLGVFVALTLEELSGRSRAGRSGLLSLLVVIVLPLVDMALCRLLDRREGTKVSDGGSGARASFGPVIRKGVHILVTVGGAPGDRRPLEHRPDGPGQPGLRRAHSRRRWSTSV